MATEHKHGSETHDHLGGDHPHVHNGETDKPWAAVRKAEKKK